MSTERRTPPDTDTDAHMAELERIDLVVAAYDHVRLERLMTPALAAITWAMSVIPDLPSALVAAWVAGYHQGRLDGREDYSVPVSAGQTPNQQQED